ncbi:hypothetical protein KRX51_03240 [Corynebacterium sp. TAE3-ERU12]|uniref:hypothetical protein n=1 Tax=Corynebacterium sp. TAE3-ERU12 TaxID=2849491 RepID=UPI001C43E832|nr:hypothetical protein [Corynebacterium sp. TAE3-ERU12]MBV7294933.1 hypothetical protein [Corynebacterium sp. TAE3-ERU12]
MTIHCHGHSSAEIEQIESLWRRSWDYDRDGELVVTTPNGQRRLYLRLMSEPQVEVSIDPHVTGYTRFVMVVRAGEPDYVGTALTDTFVFDGRTYAGHVTVSNPGDLPMFLRWSLKAPASWILPDWSWTRDPADWRSAYAERLIALPFQRWHHDPAKRQDARIHTSLMDLQGVATDGHQFQARWNGQMFEFPVPPNTPPTQIPVAVNPIPHLPEILRALNIPPSIPAKGSYALAQALTGVLGNIPTDTVLSWTPEELIERIDEAADQLTVDDMDEWLGAVRDALKLPSAGELITTAYGSVAQMAGASAKVYCVPLYSRPWGVVTP